MQYPPPNLDDSIGRLRLKVLRTPYRSPQANSLRERLIGSIRRECLDFMIPLNERHLRWLLSCWRDYYNHSRPHVSLGAGVPDPPTGVPARLQAHRYRIPDGFDIVARPLLGGLHHDYAFAVA